MNKSVMCGMIVAGFTVFSAMGAANADCSADFGWLKGKIGSGDFKNSRDKDNLLTKADSAEAKYDVQKYSDSIEKLEYISEKVGDLADAPKPKLSGEDADKISKAARETVDCVKAEMGS